MDKRTMLRVAAVGLLALFIGLLLFQREPKDLPLADVEKEWLAAVDQTGCQRAAALRFRRAYGLNAEDFAEVLYYEPASNMDVTEYLVIKLADESQQAAALEAVEQRLAVQKKNFDGYGTDQTEILGKAQTFAAGRYVCLVVSAKSREAMDELKKILEV